MSGPVKNRVGTNVRGNECPGFNNLWQVLHFMGSLLEIAKHMPTYDLQKVSYFSQILYKYGKYGIKLSLRYHINKKKY